MANKEKNGKKKGNRDDIPIESLIEPDKDLLDEEWVRQPKLYHTYAVKLANAKMNVEEAKADYDLAEAELKRVAGEVSLKIRKEPNKYGIEKITEDAVNSRVINSNAYKEARSDVDAAAAVILDYKHKVDIIAAAVRAIEHRKESLENLVKLVLADYYSTPRIDGNENARRTVDDIEKRSAYRKASKRLNKDD